MSAALQQPSREDFAALLEESFLTNEISEGSVVKGKVVAIEKDVAVIDIGAKTEGRVALKEFAGPNRDQTVKVGDEVEVYVERIENALGEAVISRDKARREESWVKLEKAFEAQERVNGVIFNQVKGGYTVDLDGAVAFLPRSQVDIRPVRDVTPLMGVSQPFQILKMDRRRGNIVVSRRTVLEESRAEQRSELVANLEEGQVIDGVVKNITEYGAFVDLGGIDGLLHVTDMAWRRVNHPSEVVTIGQTVKVKIIKINHETHRISLGIKQLLADPWEGIAARYPVGAKLKGPRHEHHRLRRVRGAGAGHRRPDPRVRDVLDQEERPPGQDHLHLPGGRGGDPRGRSGEAPHLAGPEADAPEPVGGLRREAPLSAPPSRAR
jgi:small subunit ribosomal protein S1